MTDSGTPSPTAAPAAQPAATPDAPAQPALWVERTGPRLYTGRSERGGVVHIGGSEAPDTFTPGELLKIALAGCTGLSSDVPFARRLGDDYDAVIHVSGAKDVDEERYPTLVERLEVDLSALEPAAAERLLTVVQRAIDQACTVGRTLTAGTTVELHIESVTGADRSVDAEPSEA